MRPIGTIFACTPAFGLLLVLVGCAQSSPTAPTQPPSPSPSPAPPIEWNVQNGGNGHHYQLSLALNDAADHFLSWTQARARAQGLMYRGVPGHLATVASPEENTFLVENIVPAARTPAPLLGGYQPPGSAEPAGGWRWVTGEPFVYTNWAPFEPNEAVPDADYLVFTANPEPTIGTWNDVADVVSAYVVEYDTAPSGTSASISQTVSFSGAGGGTIDVSPFDPALGVLDRVDVAISGTLTVTGATIPNVIGPFGVLIPHDYRITVTQDFSGVAGRYFDFSPPAMFLIDRRASGAGEGISLGVGFTYDFSFTDITDIVGLVIPTTTATTGALIPPAGGALGTRAGFVLTPPPINQILIAQTWHAVGLGGPDPAITSVNVDGMLAITYHYTAADPTIGRRRD